MDISNIKIILTEKDLEGIINEVLSNYMKVSEIRINSVVIDKFIILNGTFTKKIGIPFELKMSILDLENNKLTLVINKINIKKLNIANIIKNFALKRIADKFKEYGISVAKDIVKVDLNKLCAMIPMVKFNLKGLNLIPYGIEAQVSDFRFIKSEVEKKVEKPDYNYREQINKANFKNEMNDNNAHEENSLNSSAKIGYYYSEFRTNLRKKLSTKYEFLHKYIVIIPDIIALLFRLYKDERVSKEIKANIIVAIAYLMYPLDIFPDIIPFLGKVDDVTIVFFILYRVLCDIPEEVIVDNWEGEENIIIICKETVEFLSKIFGINEVKKISTLVSRVLKKGYTFFLK